LTGQYSDTVNLNALLTTAGGEGIAGKPVTFTVGQTTYSAVTDVYGLAAAAIFAASMAA